MRLNAVQVRVLGALMEKEIATPETYPLSLNALLAACNQRSSREPVMELGEEEVRQALHGLEELALTAPVRDARVAKYEHRARTVLNLRRDETAVMCLLFLRGPQTPGELRQRADRLHSFDDLEAVESTLARLAARAGEGEAGPLVAMLERRPGARESRYAQLLGGPVEAGPVTTAAQRAPAEAPGLAKRVEELEAEVARLAGEIREVRAAVEDMRAEARSTEVPG